VVIAAHSPAKALRFGDGLAHEAILAVNPRKSVPVGRAREPFH
jgi:hypothetical protein